MPASSHLDSRNAAIALLLFVLIAYGSLYPFVFSQTGVPPDIFAAFLATAREPFDRGDIISNVLLYFPLSFFAVRTFPRHSMVLRVAIATLAGTFLSTSIELLQFYDRGRSPDFYDAAANTAGAVLGAIAGVRIGRMSAPLLLLGTWFASRLIPYLPSLDPRKYEIALRSLATRPDPLETFCFFAYWLTAAFLLDQIVPPQWRPRALAGGILVVFLARIALVDTTLSPAEAIGAIAAAALWIALLSRVPFQAILVSVILALAITLYALAPFHFVGPPRRFDWVPFRSFMDGPRENGSRQFLQKTFIYGALVWLLCRAGLSFLLATLSAVALVFSVRLAETYLPSRFGSVTDPLLVLSVAVLLRFLPAEE